MKVLASLDRAPQAIGKIKVFQLVNAARDPESTLALPPNCSINRDHLTARQVILGGRVAKETRRTVDLGHSSDGPSLIDLAEIHVNVPESRFVACLHLQQNRPEADNLNDEFMRSAARCRSAANDRTQVVPFGARHSSL